MARPRIWTKDKVIEEIIRRHRKKLPLDGASLRNNGDCKLLSGGTYVFGSWKKAIKAAGLDYNSITYAKIDYWNKKRIIAEIRGFARTGVRLASKFVQTYHGDLYSAALDCFGLWGKAVEAAGLDYDSIREKRKNYWNAKRVLAQIRRLARTGFRLSQKSTEHEFGDLVAAARRHFGNWGNAVETAGCSYRLHCRTWSYKAWLRRLDEGQLEAIKRQAAAFAREKRSE